MATYYVDPAAGGANNGTSWTDAWTTCQSAFDTATAGDIVYLRGTETIAATIDVDTNSGDTTNGLIKFIGCNAGGTNDGTRFVMDANSANIIGVNITRAYLWFENIEAKNSGNNDGFQVSTTGGMLFLNCCANNNGGHGFDANPGSSSGVHFIRCAAYGNTSDGFRLDAGDTIIFSSAFDNGNDGIGLAGRLNTVIGCIAHGNTAQGIDGNYRATVIFNNVLDANGIEGLQCTSGGGHIGQVIGNRFTNQNGAGDAGLDCNSQVCAYGWNYYQDNTTDITNSTIAQEILYNGAGTDDENQGDSNEGYTDLTGGSEDFNLTSSATLRRQAITIPTT